MRPRFFNRGDWRLRRCGSASNPSFNEAAVLQPRRPEGVQRLDVQPFRASMRPRFFNRGDHGRSPVLAFGDPAASMRPRFFNRGDGAAGRDHRLPGHASMRPRFFNRGDVVPGQHERDDPLAASMRPRFFNRGDLLRPVTDMRGSCYASMRPRFFNRGDTGSGSYAATVRY